MYLIDMQLFCHLFLKEAKIFLNGKQKLIKQLEEIRLTLPKGEAAKNFEVDLVNGMRYLPFGFNFHAFLPNQVLCHHSYFAIAKIIA